jgi:hypothetical protein
MSAFLLAVLFVLVSVVVIATIRARKPAATFAMEDTG